MLSSGTKGALVALITLSTTALSVCPVRAVTLADVRKKMGSRFEITAIHSDPAAARRALDAAWLEIDRIEAMISSWRPMSVTSEVNRQAGIRPLTVPPELFNLVRRSLKLSELTGGAFDITFAGIGQLWDFKAAEPHLPDRETIARALENVGYGKIVLDEANSAIYLTAPETRIGFGAIGKGYAANRAVFVLQEHGVADGVVNASGDLVAFGTKEDGTSWDVGIAHPLHRGHIFAHLPLSEMAVVTSGDYESYLTIDGQRYPHILDPRTGWPVKHLRSVTIVCPDAELADGLATAVFVMGPERGLELVDRLRGIEALLVDMDGKLYFSRNLRSQLEFADTDAATGLPAGPSRADPQETRP